MWAQYLLLFTLSLLALVSAYGVARRFDLAAGAEEGLAACMLWNALILAPTHLLGVMNQLTAPKLAVTSVLVSVGAFVAAASGRGIRAHAEETLGAMRDAAASLVNL